MEHTVVIYGSPHKSSATGQALNNYITKNSIICNYLFNCYSNLPNPCVDCGYCKTHSNCKFDDLTRFYAEFEMATNVIFAFPVYNGSFPAPLKALIDRMQVYFNARFARNIKPPIPTHKKVTIIMVCGSNRDYKQLILEQITPVFTVTNCELANFIEIKNTDYK